MKKHCISRGGLKSFMIFGIAFLSIISCRQQKFEDVVTPQDADPIGEVLTADQALDQLYSFIDAMSPATRAEGRFSKAKSIREIKVSGGGLTTRGTICDVPDTLVYVVNFVDDEGFAVLGARRSGEPIYALTESGSFDADKLNAAIAEAQYRMLNGDDAATRSGSVDEPMEEVGLDIIYPLMAEAMIAPTPRITTPILIKEEPGPWVGNYTVGPLVKVKWDQRYPFNIAMPIAQSHHTSFAPETNYKGRYPAGCVMVAVAQIISTTMDPAIALGTNNRTYLWKNIVDNVARYSNVFRFSPNNYDAKTSVAEKMYTEQFADVLRRLAEDMYAGYSSTGTGTQNQFAVDYLRNLNPNYYRQANIYDLNNIISKIYTCLDNNKSVCIIGRLPDNSAGHAWVVDGYKKCKRDVVQYYQNGYMPVFTRIKPESCVLWHCNWGYGGRNDGYFAEAVFNMNNRIMRDDAIDNNGIEDQNLGLIFSVSLKAITY